MSLQLSQKLVDRLRKVKERTDGNSGMYPGEWWEIASKQHSQLERHGLVEAYYPHNPIHKTRAVITDKGREFLKVSP